MLPSIFALTAVALTTMVLVLSFLVGLLQGEVTALRGEVTSLKQTTDVLVECGKTTMREGLPYVEDVISVDERSFYQPQHGEEGRPRLRTPEVSK